MRPDALIAFLILATAPVAVTSCTSKGARKGRGDDLSTWRDSSAWPRSVDAAVDTLLAELSPTDRDRLRTLPEDSLWSLHLTLGLDIRNQYGLWRGNVALLQSCGQKPPYVPDTCSGLIIMRARERLQRSGMEPPNQRLKLSARGGRLVGNGSVLSAAAAGRSLSAIR
jgi:hypothetical protein